MTPMERIDLGVEELEPLLEHARERLSEEDYRKLKAAIDTLEYLTELVADKDTTIRHLRQLLLPTSTEKTKDILAQLGKASTGDKRSENRRAVLNSPSLILHPAMDATVPRTIGKLAKCRSRTPS